MASTLNGAVYLMSGPEIPTSSKATANVFFASLITGFYRRRKKSLPWGSFFLSRVDPVLERVNKSKHKATSVVSLYKMIDRVEREKERESSSLFCQELRSLTGFRFLGSFWLGINSSPNLHSFCAKPKG